MRQMPYRPGNEISQTFNSGILTVYDQKDKAEPGHIPKPFLTKKAVLRYEEQRLGLNRYYAAKQNNVDVNRVVRVPASNIAITPQDVIKAENGLYYEIDMVQTVQGVWPACLDLTLKRFEQVAAEEEAT